VVLLVLDVGQGLQASWDPLATGKKVLATVVVMVAM
jgi:hypothetical protein